MINRVLAVGLLAGLLAGLVIAVLQHYTTTPLIIAAEVYEKSGAAPGKEASLLERASFAPAEAHAQGLVHFAHEGHDHAGHDHGGASSESVWSPKDGLERTLYTALATVGAAVGCAMLLLAGMLASGEEIDANRAIAWGAAAFFTAGLAPAAGLAPDLPGSAAADLLYRQSWWVGTAILTAVSLWLFLLRGGLWPRVIAVLLLLLPHAAGAPHPLSFESKVPAELAAQFAAMSLMLQAALWIVTGFAVGALWPRFGREAA